MTSIDVFVLQTTWIANISDNILNIKEDYYSNDDAPQKIKFSVKDFFSKCDQIRFSFYTKLVSCGFGHIYWGNA